MAGHAAGVGECGEHPRGVVGFACRDEVGDRAATWEYGIGDSRVAAINDNGRTQIRIGALILVVRHAIMIAIVRCGRDIPLDDETWSDDLRIVG